MPTLFRRWDFVIVCLLSLILSGCASRIAEQSTTSSVTPLSTVAVGTNSIAQVSSNFMGYSLEWESAETIMGKSSTGSDAIFQKLEENLTAYGSGPIVIRVGGYSTDVNTKVNDVVPFAELYQHNGTPFILGVNLKAQSLPASKAQAATYYSVMPTGSLSSIEIGNESNFYLTLDEYTNLLSTWVPELRSVTTANEELVLPSCIGTCPTWNLGNMMSNTAYKPVMASLHYYPLHCCAVTPPNYLITNSANQGASIMSSSVASAHAAGSLFRIGEMNSVGWSGQGGISNTFQSALWILQNAFAYAAKQVDGINIHGNWLPGTNTSCPGSLDCYSPAIITVTQGFPNQFTLTHVNPIYYGMLAFQMATGNEAKIYPTTVTSGTSTQLIAWDTIDNTATERMVLINEDALVSGSVKVVPVGKYSHATVCYLTADSYAATSGVSLCGQTFDGSTDGTIQGAASYTRISPNSGIYSIPLRAAQAAIVRFYK